MSSWTECRERRPSPWPGSWMSASSNNSHHEVCTQVWSKIDLLASLGLAFEPSAVTLTMCPVAPKDTSRHFVASVNQTISLAKLGAPWRLAHLQCGAGWLGPHRLGLGPFRVLHHLSLSLSNAAPHDFTHGLRDKHRPSVFSPGHALFLHSSRLLSLRCPRPCYGYWEYSVNKTQKSLLTWTHHGLVGRHMVRR